MKSFGIIGFGAAGYEAALAIRERDKEAQIHVFETNPLSVSNPMLTTYYASGKTSFEGMFPFGQMETISKSLELLVHPETTVKKVVGNEKCLVLSDGSEKTFDSILISTGAFAFVPPFPNEIPEKTLTVRTPQDAIRLYDSVRNLHPRKAVVVGASMVGIKVVEFFLKNGIETVLIDFAPFLFPLAATPEVAEELKFRLENLGLKFIFNASVVGISTKGVDLKTGETIPADIVCLCVGTRANTGIVDESIKTARGITVDDRMQTSASGIFAAGDCCESKNVMTGQRMVIGLWANAKSQGRVAGANMAGADLICEGNVPHNVSHFCDIDFVGIGDNRQKGISFSSGKISSNNYVCATKAENGKIACINIIGNIQAAGSLKSFFLSQYLSPKAVMNQRQKMKLHKSGLSSDFISFLLS